MSALIFKHPTTGTLFQGILPFLSDHLVIPEKKMRIEKLASTFPVLSWSALECRLTGQENQVDFMMSFNQDELRKYKLSGPGPHGLAQNHPHYAWIQGNWSFLSRISGHDFLSRFLDVVWLEYDLDTVHDKEPLFFTVYKKWPYDFGLLAALIVEQASKLTDVDTSALSRCIMGLDGAMSLYSLGFLQNRGPKLVRLVVRAETFSMVLHYLKNISWPGDIEDFQSKIEAYLDLADSFLIHLNVGEKVQSTLGLELCFDWSHYLDRLDRCLQRMVGTGLCDPKKHQAIMDWNGSSAWNAKKQIRRYVNYVKLSYSEDQTLQAKVYLLYRLIEN